MQRARAWCAAPGCGVLVAIGSRFCSGHAKAEERMRDALGLSAPFVRRMAALGWVLVTDEANRLARRRRGGREFVVYKQGGLGVEAR